MVILRLSFIMKLNKIYIYKEKNIYKIYIYLFKYNHLAQDGLLQ
jgi:hypothetical protein